MIVDLSSRYPEAQPPPCNLSRVGVPVVRRVVADDPVELALELDAQSHLCAALQTSSSSAQTCHQVGGLRTCCTTALHIPQKPLLRPIILARI